MRWQSSSFFGNLVTMIRLLCCIMTLLMAAVANAQQPALVLYEPCDTTTWGIRLAGVRTTSGTEIIPPKYWSPDYNNGDTIISSLILLAEPVEKKDAMGYQYHYRMYDRAGRFLYSPYWFDNGTDYYTEGLSRYVEKGKMGFADWRGNRVIPAKYAYVMPYYRGYAVACLDCKYVKVSKDEEHCCQYVGKKKILINRRGEKVYEFAEGTGTITDSLLATLPVADSLARTDSDVVQLLRRLPEVKAAYDEMEDGIAEGRITGFKETAIHPVVCMRPAEGLGDYLVAFRDVNGLIQEGLCFLVSKDGQRVCRIGINGRVEVLDEGLYK